MHQPRFQWHRRIVHTALDHLLRTLPTPVLPNVAHSPSCEPLAGCLTATPSFPTLSVQVGCLQRTVQLGLSVTTQLWLGEGWERMRTIVREQCLCAGFCVPFLGGKDPALARLRTGRALEAVEAWFWRQTMPDPSAILPLAPLLAMEMAFQCGATVDWEACQIAVHEDRLLTDQDAALLAETYQYALHRISLRAAQVAPRPDPATPPAREHRTGRSPVRNAAVLFGLCNVGDCRPGIT